MVGVGFRCGWLVGGAFPGVAAAVGQRRGWPTVFLRAVSADQCGFSCAVISRRLPKLVESLIAPKLLLTALFSFLSRQSYLRYIFFFFLYRHANSTDLNRSFILLNLPVQLFHYLPVFVSFLWNHWVGESFSRKSIKTYSTWHIF